MEQITLEMIKLLKSRTEVAQKIGNIKSELGITVTDDCLLYTSDAADE